MRNLINKKNDINIFKSIFPEFNNIIMEDFLNILVLKSLVENNGFKLEYIKIWTIIDIRKNILHIKEKKYSWDIDSIFWQTFLQWDTLNILIIDINKKIILSSTIFPDIKKINNLKISFLFFT